MPQKRPALLYEKVTAVVITGPLGVGKTSLVKALLNATSKKERGRLLGLIINDAAMYATDVNRIRHAFGDIFSVKGIVGGCLSCTNLSEFEDGLRQLEDQEGVVIIEPTGIADGNEIKQVLDRFGIKSSFITLINPTTFQHDMRSGILPSQLDVATLIGITRPEGLSDADREKLAVALAPYGVPAVDVVLGNAPKLGTLLAGATTSHHHDGTCSCGCEHGHGHHHHDDGNVTTSIRLHGGVTVAMLREICERNAPYTRRVKGATVEGYEFDGVSGAFAIGALSNEQPYAVFIGQEAPPADIITRLSAKRPSAQTLEEHLANLSTAEADAEVRWRLTQVSGDAVVDEHLELAILIAEEQASPDVLVETIRHYVEHMLEVSGRLDLRRARPNDLMEAGAGMLWYAQKSPLELGESLLAEVRERQPATMHLTGLKRTAKENPAHCNALTEEYEGVLSPGTASELIPEWGMAHEGLTAEEIARIFRLMAEIPAPYPEWSEEWLSAADKLRADA